MAVAAVTSGGIADHIHPEPQGFVRRYVFSLDHKIIGIQYIITAFVFFMLAGLLAEAIRTQLLNPNGGFVVPDTTMKSTVFTAAQWSGWSLSRCLPEVSGISSFLCKSARAMSRSLAQHAQLLDLPGRGTDAILIVPDGRTDRRLDGVSPGLAARRGRNLDVVRGNLLGGHQLDDDGLELHRDDLEDARSRHDFYAHAALRLGVVRNGSAADDRDDRSRRSARCTLHRAAVRCALLRSDQRRQRGHVAAHVLVLLASGRLYHGFCRPSASSPKCCRPSRASQSSATS